MQGSALGSAAVVVRATTVGRLPGQRVVVFDAKEGRRHAHCVWSRIDAATMTATSLAHTQRKLQDVSRALYLEHGWTMPQGMIDPALRNPLNVDRAGDEARRRHDASFGRRNAGGGRPLFRTIGRGTDALTRTPLPQANAYAMIRRRATAAGIELGNHSFRATGITATLENGGTLEKAAQMANHSSTRTTQLYDRRADEVTMDEVERVVI